MSTTSSNDDRKFDVLIHRGKKTANFVQIANRIVDDQRLSFFSLGILVYLLAKTPNWHCRVSNLIRGEPGTRGGRRDAVRARLKQLRELGFISLVRLKKKDGTFRTTYHVYEFPEDNPFPDPLRPRTTKP